MVPHCQVLPMESSRWKSIFGTIERTVALVYHIIQAKVIQRAAQAFRCYFPVLIASHAVFRPCGQLHMILKSEQAVNLIDELCNTLDLGT